jgi:VanZ family protein
VARELPASPLYLLFHSLEIGSGRRFVADVIINVAIYIPMGMSAFLAFRRFRHTGPIVLGAVLSGSIEMAQLFTPGRRCSTLDLLNNIAGSAAGVLAGMLFERIAGPVRKGAAEFRAPDPSALASVFCWAASLVFPFFPVMNLADWDHKLAVFAQGPAFASIPLISAAANWVAVAYMIRAMRVRRIRLWLAFSLLLIPIQFAIATRQPMPADLIGAVAGIVLFLVTENIPSGISFAAWAFIGVLTVRGLAPFHWDVHGQSFTWIPFGGFLNSEWQYGIQLILQKTFSYGAAIWMLRRAAMRWLAAIFIVCAVLAAIEVIQIHLPGRTAETTDPLLALLAGLGLRVLERPARTVGYHANS